MTQRDCAVCWSGVSLFGSNAECDAVLQVVSRAPLQEPAPPPRRRGPLMRCLRAIACCGGACHRRRQQHSRPANATGERDPSPSEVAEVDQLRQLLSLQLSVILDQQAELAVEHEKVMRLERELQLPVSRAFRSCTRSNYFD